jgi:predicted NBD/HSP70 family sugar kinase
VAKGTVDYELNIRGLGIRDLRVLNELRLLHVIRDQHQISRTRISELTGLHTSTITLIVKRLLANGMVSEGSLGSSTGGRRPIYLTLNADKALVLGVDLGVRQTSYAVSDFRGRVLFSRTLPTQNGPEQFLTWLCLDIKNHMKGLDLEKKLRAVGVSVAGLVDVTDGTLIFAPNQGWTRVPVRAYIEQSMRLPTFVENDATSSALGEIWLGPASVLNYTNIVYVLVVEGIGTGLILDGRLYRGSRIGTGGFGHMILDPNGPLCSCGRRGCWEALASEKAIRQLHAQRAHRPSEEDPSDIVDAALRGNPLPESILRQIAEYLGLGILNLIHGLSPQAVIVGGNVARAWSIIGPLIRETIHSHLLIPGLIDVQIMPSSIPTPSLYGAIAVALSNILQAELGRITPSTRTRSNISDSP